MRSFNELLETHADLDALFFEHQRALLRHDWAEAALRLEEFETILLGHIQIEDERLIPVYAERAGYVRGGDPEFFRGEHRKMREMIEWFKEQMPRLAATDDVDRALIKMLDAETSFKHLVEHHNTREEQMLYPVLDRVTTEEERKRLLADSTTSQQKTVEA